MKLYVVLSLFLILNSAYSEKLNWDDRFKKLCKYDVKFCNSLKNNEGEWKQPKKEMVMALRELAPSINRASKDFGVDARAIAGSILAENSLNVSISDEIQDWLVKMKIAGKGDLLGKQFSFGWGQLYMKAALEAEPIMAKVEGRKERTPEEVAAALLKPDESIRYVAAVIKTIQENYKKEGFNIRDKPEILTTLYNLGGSKKRASQAKLLNRKPRINYFGFFVEKNLDVLNIILDPEVNKKTLINQEFWNISESQGGIDNFLSYFRKRNKRPKEIARRATEEIILVHAPPQCSLGSNGASREYIQSSTLRQSKPSGTIQRKEGFRELSSYLDCDLDEWKLVEVEDGSRKGWVSLSHVKEKSRPSDILKLCEDSYNTSRCIENLKKIPNLDFLLIDSKTDSFLISLHGKKEKINWKKPDVGNWCLSKNKKPSSRRIKPKFLKEEEIRKLAEGLREFEKKVGNIIDKNYFENSGDYCFDCFNNPYSFLSGTLNFWALKKCSVMPDASQNKNQCSGNVDSYLKGLNALKIKSKPSWGDIKLTIGKVSLFRDDITQIHYSNANIDSEKIIKDIKNKISYCTEIAKGYPKSTKLLNNKLKELDSPSMQMIYVSNRSTFDYLKDQCQSLKDLYIEKENNSKDCSHCQNGINVYMPISGYSRNQSFLSLNIIRKMLKSEEDKDSFLVDQFKAQFLNFNNYGNLASQEEYEDSCSYDPEATAAMIEEISKLSCVREIYVPDPWLINYFTRKKERVPFLKAFIEDDRFEININKRYLCKK